MGWKDAPLVDAPAPAGAPAKGPAWASAPLVEEPKATSLGQTAINAGKGVLSGFADLGDTLLNVGTYLPGKVVPAIERWNTERNASLEDFNRANADSTAFTLGRVGGNVAATLPVGGVTGAGIKALFPASKAAQVIGTSVTTGGLRTGANLGLGADLAARTVGGAISGGLSTALVNPSDTLEGAVVGGVLPGVVKGFGAAGRAVDGFVAGPQVPPQTAAAVQAARGAGYVVPPTMANPTLTNRVIEGVAGKQSVGQNASLHNQQITNDLIRKALGIGDDVPLTLETLDAIRKEAGGAYANIAGLGPLNASGAKLPPSVAVSSGVDPLMVRRTEVDAGEIVRAWKQANHDATAYYRAYARDANPETLAKAKAASDAAKQIDDFMTTSLEAMGRSDLLTSLKEARVRIAKTYNAEAALNEATGNFSAPKLGAQLTKGKPLSGELRQVAEFSNAFPKAAQMPEKMGSLPGTTPLDWAAAGTVSGVTGNPFVMGGVASRPLARSLALSPLVQNRLGQAPQAAGDATSWLSSPENRQALELLFLRALPVAATSGP